MLHSLKRGPVAGSLISLVSVAMVAFTAGPVAQASPRAAAPAQQEVAQAQKAPVLSSEYGKARSRITDGTFSGGGRGDVTGTFKPRKFVVNDRGVMKAVGVLEATLTRNNGNVVGTDRAKVRIPVMTIEGTPVTSRLAAPGDCDILNLVLGPLDLNLLGLQVDLAEVVLNIVAVPGAGNLLGNLLCAVAGLLDGPGLGGLLDQIGQILNSILAILRL
jgi:hypothetical protein